MWLPVVVRHDANFLRVCERTLRQHLADELNKLESEHGEIKFVSIVQHRQNKFIEAVVKVEDDHEI
jgi:hypothetical protein